MREKTLRSSTTPATLLFLTLLVSALLPLVNALPTNEFYVAELPEDPGGGFEPHVLAGPSYDGSGQWYYYDSPTGLGGSQGGNLWISKDRGYSWQWYDKDTLIGSSGDSFTTISSQGNIYYTDLYLSSASVDTSLDGGQTWVPNPVASQWVIDDRQWLDIGPSRDGIGDETLYFSFNQIPSGLVMVKAPITTGNEVPYVWQECGALPDTTARFRDNFAVNEADGMLYIANSQNNGLHVLVSDDGCNTFSKYQVNDLSPDQLENIFAIIDTDLSGNVYVGWSSRDQVWLAVSTDQGQTWTNHQVTNTTRVRALPWLAAGDEGRVVIGYYETEEQAEGTPDAQEGWWDYRVALTLDALNETPTFDFRTVQSKVHKQGIQTTGTGGGSDRDLGDFSTVDVDDLGRILVSYGLDGDDGPNARSSAPMFAGQLDGPFLREGTGPQVKVSYEMNELKLYLHVGDTMDPQFSLTNLTVDWGDDSPNELLDEDTNPAHVYPRTGSYLLTVQATNEIGMRSTYQVQLRLQQEDDQWLIAGLPGWGVLGGLLFLLVGAGVAAMMMHERGDEDEGPVPPDPKGPAQNPEVAVEEPVLEAEQ